MALWWLALACLRADGCFVFVWNKQKDINEPTQKAILLHDRGREDLVLQVKYEGPAEDFGWLVPVPGLPEVRKGSMDCFYELSRLTQEQWADGHSESAATLGVSRGKAEPVKVIEVKTVGAYDVAVLSSENATSLTEWLNANQFAFPKDKQGLLDGYIQKHWHFVAVRINPEKDGFALKAGTPKKTAIAPATRNKLTKGELHPLVLSFPSEKCVFPLAISAVNGKPSEISLYVLSAEPLMSRVIFEKKFAAYRQEREQWIKERPTREQQRRQSFENLQSLNASSARFQGPWADPADPPPPPEVMRQLVPIRYEDPPLDPDEDEYYGGRDLLRSMEVQARQLPASVKALPRLAGRSWWLTKQVQTFSPEEMRDLEFEPAVPLLAQEVQGPDGQGPAHSLAQFGERAMPVILAGLSNPDPAQRSLALSTLTELEWFRRPPPGEPKDQPSRAPADPRITAALHRLLADGDARVRARACEAAMVNWDAAFVPRLTALLRDGDARVASAASSALQYHQEDAAAQLPVFRKMLEEDGPAAPYAIRLVMRHNPELPRELLLRLLSSTNPPVVMVAASQLRRENLDPAELAPLLTNSVPMVRLVGLASLTRRGDKAAVERIVSMLRDPNEAIRWRVRSSLRRLSGQKPGSDPAAWEKWWAANKATFTPQQMSRSTWPGE